MCVILRFAWVLAASLLLTFQITVVVCINFASKFLWACSWVCFETTEYWTKLRSVTEESVSCCWYLSCHLLLRIFVLGTSLYVWSEFFTDHFLISIQGRNIALNASFTAVSAFYPLERIIMSVHAFLRWFLTWKARCLRRVQSTNQAWLCTRHPAVSPTHCCAEHSLFAWKSVV